MSPPNRWRQGSAETDEGYLQLRRQLREKRRKKGKRRDNAGVIATQNAAVAKYLKGWLERREQEPKPVGDGDEAALTCIDPV